MATIKSFTSLEQSKKLAEILPLESADRFCADVFDKDKETHSYNFHILSTWGCNTFEELKDKENKFLHFIPCWSLAALLGVLPKIINNETLFIETSVALWHIGYRNIYTARADNPVDACYEIIIKLNELNLL